MNSPTWNIDRSWSLFLDRDGVINAKLDGDYVKQVHEMHILPGVPEAIAQFNVQFQRVVVVTNQQGIGKGLMKPEQLDAVHDYLRDRLHSANARLDAVYYAPQLAEENSPMRKPNPGMGHKAQEDFPEIDFQKSIIVGDSISDMKFGKGLGMKRVFMLNGRSPHQFEPDIFDVAFEDLATFARWIAG